MQVRGQNRKNKKCTPSFLFFRSVQGRKIFCTIHVGPMDGNALFQVSFPFFHLNQTTENPLLPPYFLSLPLLPPQITPTKHTVNEFAPFHIGLPLDMCLPLVCKLPLNVVSPLIQAPPKCELIFPKLFLSFLKGF